MRFPREFTPTNSKNFLLGTQAWLDARDEVALLNKAAQTGLVPRYAKQVAVRRNGKLFAGIYMEHIEGRAMNHTQRGAKHPLIKKLKKQLRESGVDHLDLKTRHVLLNKGKVRVLDLTPEWTASVSS